ncbi:hypothetical protein DUT91_24315 [Phyllobacterium salinisoli]|uniref:Uncharacterized protein n=1 Tax=Phyllobacterium salinisoli TaxID=1899321 RepID=A0A368JWT3_9HYPH|nr:hypothetical protein [Phyllobacterium salinisoli]RCS21411.1 hypothetical protein DUT91_24315 [Phyllobacterium salinisoli]
MAISINIVSPSGIISGATQARLFATASGLDPALNYIVRWEAALPISDMTFYGNDKPLVKRAAEDTRGDNWGTKITVTGAALDKPTTLFARVFRSTDNVNTSTPLATAERVITFKALTAELTALSHSVPPSNTAPSDGKYNYIYATIKDSTGNLVEGVDVLWSARPSMSYLGFWDSTKSSTPGTSLPTVWDNNKIFYFSTSAADGKAGVWLSSGRAYQLTAQAWVSGVRDYIDTVFFASGNYQDPTGRDPTWDSLTPLDVESFQYGEYLQLDPNSTTFTSYLPDDFTQPDNTSKYFVALNDRLAQNGSPPVPPPICSYQYLNPPITDTNSPPPSADLNYLTLFAQDMSGKLSWSTPFPFYAKGTAQSNVPPVNPNDGTREADLSQAKILYLANGTITDDTLTFGKGLAVQLKQLPSNFNGQTITFAFYMNGYIPGTSTKKSDGPANPNYLVTTTIAAGTAQVLLPTRFAQGFAAYQGDSLISYVDYFIGTTPGSYIYGPYPTISAPTNT